MSRFIIRLDDACPRRNIENWDRMESLLDSYDVKPLVGVIPDCQDKAMDIYPEDSAFWSRVSCWTEKGWCIALHGYDHVYLTESGGINPMQARSEFAGVPLEAQKEKIRKAVEIFRQHGIDAKVFFAPSHTFDMNTLEALKSCSDIRIISDTFAGDAYLRHGFTFVPQQVGLARELPFKTVCFCYHPNTMSEDEFKGLEAFLQLHSHEFIPFPCSQSTRRLSLADRLLSCAYFSWRKLRRSLRAGKA